MLARERFQLRAVLRGGRHFIEQAGDPLHDDSLRSAVGKGAILPKMPAAFPVAGLMHNAV
jgi:hypothetical protein